LHYAVKSSPYEKSSGLFFAQFLQIRGQKLAFAGILPG